MKDDDTKPYFKGRSMFLNTKVAYMEAIELLNRELNAILKDEDFKKQLREIKSQKENKESK